MRRVLGTVALSLLLLAGGTATASPALAAGMPCASIVSSSLTPGDGAPHYITVRNCGGATASWRYKLNSNDWTYVSIGAGKTKTTYFPASWAKLNIQFTW